MSRVDFTDPDQAAAFVARVDAITAELADIGATLRAWCDDFGARQRAFRASLDDDAPVSGPRVSR